jgi:hypothetical protein
VGIPAGTIARVVHGLLLLSWIAPARALDKQGAAHGGEVEGPSKGQEIGGSLLLGAALYNPSYAARPDNTGLALFRLAPHLDFDLIGHRLSIPLDLNFFTDRQLEGAEKLIPTELDVITGLTSTWGLFKAGAIELGARYERDMPLDQGDFSQSYVDTRAKLLVGLTDAHPAIGDFFAGNAVNLSSTLGYFAYNPTYAARPDNTGIALLRYAAHFDVFVPKAYLGLYLDTTFFSDKKAEHKLRPTELDLTVGVALRLDPFELSIAFERDMPLDRGDYTQEMLFLYASWAFTVFSTQEEPSPKPATNQGGVLSQGAARRWLH